MQGRNYTFGELRKSILESTSEFKPKYGDDKIPSTEKSDSKQALEDIAKETSKMTGNAKNPESTNKGKSVLDAAGISSNNMACLQYDVPLDDTFKKRAQANLEGYTSDLEKQNHKNDVRGNAYHDDSIAKAAKETAKDDKEVSDNASEVGITNAQKDKEETHRHASTIGESKKVSVLKFKKVQFISESQMLVHVPDEYKKDGKKFYMQDCKGNKYLVEWHKEPTVNKMLNEQKSNAELDRIKYLFNFSSKESTTTNSMRMNENKEIDGMLDRVRQLMKN